MQKSSWIVLGLMVTLAGLLGFGYMLSQPTSETLNKEQATALLLKLKEATEKKDINTILGTISPEPGTKIVDVNHDQLRILLARAFKSTGKLTVDTSNLTFQGGEPATIGFDLLVKHADQNFVAEDYKGHITLQLKRVEVPRLLGIARAKEWRIVDVQTTGPTPASFGDN